MCVLRTKAKLHLGGMKCWENPQHFNIFLQGFAPFGRVSLDGTTSKQEEMGVLNKKIFVRSIPEEEET